MKGCLFLFLAVSSIGLFLSLPADATSGACSYHGGVDCSAGADWDGSVICNDGWRNSTVSYSSMVMCGGGSYYNSAPNCPLFSSYDYLSSSCKCNYGYVANGYGGCESGSIYCHRKLGYNSSYKSYSNTCECDYDYILDSSNQCVSKDDYCQDLYGYGAQSDHLTDKCECKSGYEFSLGQCRLADNTEDYYIPSSIFSTPTPTYTSCPLNSHSVGTSCYCDTGYQVNSTKTGCILVLPTPTPLTCSYGFLPRSGQCISNTQDCINTFGPNVVGFPGPDNNNCNCITDFQWNDTKTTCVKITASQPVQSSSPPSVVINCKTGYVPSLDKKRCIKIPENAHIANDGKNVWLCNDGYIEEGDTCSQISSPIISPDTTGGQEITKPKWSWARIFKFWEWFK